MSTQSGVPEDGQKKRWYSGVQAIFAGFVASAQGDPTINTFWESPQMPLIRTTLSTVQPPPPGIPEGRPSEEMETALKNVLLVILRDDSNDMSRPRVDLDGKTFEERLDIPWRLTEKGRSRFENAAKGGANGGHLAVGMWWNDDSQTSSPGGSERQ